MIGSRGQWRDARDHIFFSLCLSERITGDDGEELARLRDQNNELWGEVRYTREAVLDGENIDLLATKASRQAEKIVQVS